MSSQTELLSAYLIMGEDELRKGKALEHMDARLVKAGGDPSFDKEVFDGEQSVDPSEVRASLDLLPFMSEFRLVVIKNVDKASKAVQDTLTEYLAAPAPTTVLIMTALKVAKNTRLYKACAKIGDKAVLEYEKKTIRDLPQEVQKMALAHGVSIYPDAVDLLIRYIGDSTLMLDNEIKKLAVAILPKKTIEAQDVATLVTRTSEVKPWDFTQAIGVRDAANAMRLLSLMPSQNLIGLFTLTVSRLRELLVTKTLDAKGKGAQLAQELGLQNWQVKNHHAWARNYTEDELRDALISAVDCEIALKTTPDKETAFKTWILSFCN
ncbi:MAG: DNA polymerase III subunit delta [Coriobacteriales bacterium]|nr:DNA polymerase III subunit delta [Coriobacteriales bacterium]